MKRRGFPQVPFPHSGLGPFQIFRHESEFLFGWSGRIPHDDLLRAYGAALVEGCEIFSVHLRRSLPRPPIRVNVFEISSVLPGASGAFTYLDEEDSPVICLPCGSSNKPTLVERDAAVALAYHELTHVFNWSQRNPRLPDSQPWLWLDEALALLIEAKFRGASSSLHSHANSVNAFSLNDPRSEELATLFTSFLEFQVDGGLEAVFRLFDAGTIYRDPMEAIGEGDFMSGFHSFAKAAFFKPGIFERNLAPIRDAIVPEAVVWLGSGIVGQTFSGVLDHLSFHWYDCHVDPGSARELVIRLTSKEHSKLMASAIPVEVGEDAFIKAGREYHLFGDDAPDLEPLAIPLCDTDGEPLVRIFFVISNCGTRGDEQISRAGDGRGYLLVEHDDDVRYDLTVELR